MHRSIAVFVVIFSVFSSFIVLAGKLPEKTMQISNGEMEFLHGGPAAFGKTEVDSIMLIGPWLSSASVNGQFQTAEGVGSWNDWTHHDANVSENHWHLSDFHAEDMNSTINNIAMYCGDETIAACDNDEVGGYGNNWNCFLAYTYEVDDPTQSCDVQWTGLLKYDTEPGYDFIKTQFITAGGAVVQADLDGQSDVFEFVH
ncbi:MAG: hypothetical protein GY780_10030, partial [bacterium]|nr:hypothetical protein [bacterium]